ncbi:uncharacterized protein LOC120067627 [Benincasa hispida]|uniref:uncharacterized protein LOC120067627 n=1 Tax=Benincasa hispida TaxID=102211 RepID=UPI0018FF8EC9|nr:uncharacterized protein LOC120067627 [Benincasa hispida]
MPNYVKFMKDILLKKNKFKKYEMIGLTEECSAVLQKKLPQKLKDLGSFTICCTIGSLTVARALCDLNFVVLDMEDFRIPIIMGSPFVATGKALIDVQKGELTLRVNDENVAFNIFKSLKHHGEVNSCNMMDVIDRTVEEHCRFWL